MNEPPPWRVALVGLPFVALFFGLIIWAPLMLLVLFEALIVGIVSYFVGRMVVDILQSMWDRHD